MPRVFLSYSRDALDIALKVYGALSYTPNVDVWFDRELLYVGDGYKDIIEREISKADYFVALLSSGYDPKKFQHIELCEAIREHRKRIADNPDDHFILPVYLGPVQVEVPGFAALHRLDWRDDPRIVLATLRRTIKHSFRSRAESESRVRCQTHMANFRGLARDAYFLKVANICIPPFAITHVWVETTDQELFFDYPKCRPLPSAILGPGSEWETFLFCDLLPGHPDRTYYEKFRIRLSNGDLYKSYKNNNVAAYGKIAGGPLMPGEPPKILKLPL